MLESLLLKNFQAHRKLEIKFSPRITCIVGPSDVGKTAIVRALRWAFLNEGLGGIQRHGTKKTSVKVVVDDKAVVRKRSRSSNSYALNGKDYDAVRRDVPQAITSVLRVQPINFQGQHDSPYWLSESGGEVSRQLNAIVDLGIIDRTLTSVANRHRDAKTILAHTKRSFQDAKQEVRRLAWVRKARAHYQAIQQEEKALGRLRQKAANLGVVLAKVQVANQALESGKDRAVGGHNLARMARASYKSSQRRRGLQNVLGKAVRAATVASVQLPEPHTANFAMHHRMQLEELLGKLEQETNVCGKLETKLQSTSARLDKLQKGRCPICGSKIKS
jgi:DNA repair ATPase RecN